jgi:hypothetical protein
MYTKTYKCSMFICLRLPMKVISFDIGIKNMAYCIFDTHSQTLSKSPTIVDWDVVNLLDTASAPNPDIAVCGCLVGGKKSAKQPGKPCGKKAQYTKNGESYCGVHAKASPTYQIPQKEHTLVYLKKQKADVIGALYTELGLTSGDAKLTKPQMMDAIFAHYNSRNFVEIPKIKKRKTANDTDLVSIGWAIKREFDLRAEHLAGVSHVVIENQISPIATRMKTIQGMLTQYFIMRSTPENPVQIQYVSSSNKLAGMPSVSDTSEKSSYRANKKDGIVYCSRYLANNPEWAKWTSMMSADKKDDLADCFLQGIWYLKSQKTITCAENLKINSV